MRHSIWLLFPALTMLALSGCGPKWCNGKCEISDNCAMQPGFGMVCVLGKRVSATSRTCPAAGGTLLPVYFELDRSLLSEESMEAIAKDADFIRGTESSANRTEWYQGHLGIPPTSIKAVSFGRRWPPCFEPTESCRQKNRRNDVNVC